MRRLPVICAALVAALGVGAAVAVADTTTSTATQCATTTSGAHTSALVVDGVTQSTKTTGGDSLSVCATATATATNSTVTTTVPGPTTTVTTTVGTTTSPPPPSYLFDDEFNGASGTDPSSTLWNAKNTTMPTGVSMDGWSNIQEDGSGHVVITATKDSSGTWHSGWLTGNVGSFSFGGSPYDVQARAKVACGVGTWSSPVWTWGAPYGGAPSIEDDVVEHLDGKESDGYHATLHNWNGGSSPANGQLVSTGLPLCQSYHVYESKVYADHIDFYFDGTLEGTATASSVGLTNLLSSQQVANISMNMGGWAGTPTGSGPYSLSVDYIRVSALS